MNVESPKEGGAVRTRQNADLVVADLSDTHLDGSSLVRDRVRAVATALSKPARSVDAIVVTGDLTEPGRHSGDELQFLEDLLRPIAPVVYVPGNSDERPTLRRFLGLPVNASPIHRAVLVDSLRLVLIDTCIPGQIGGWLDDDALDSVEQSLGTLPPEELALLVMHHPPRMLGHGYVDTVRAFGDVSRLEALVHKHPGVIGTLVGHTHAATFAGFGGKPMFVATGIHSAGQPPNEFTGGRADVINGDAPPAFMVHHVDGDDDIVTYSRTLR